MSLSPKDHLPDICTFLRYYIAERAHHHHHHHSRRVANSLSVPSHASLSTRHIRGTAGSWWCCYTSSPGLTPIAILETCFGLHPSSNTIAAFGPALVGYLSPASNSKDILVCERLSTEV